MLGDVQDVLAAIARSTNNSMVVVTTAADAERGGCLVGFHSQSSIDPERYAVWLSKANRTYQLALRATHVAIWFLHEDDVPLAERFGTQTGDEVDKFEGLDVVVHDVGVPLPAGRSDWLVLRRTAVLDEGGDHVCVTLDVVDGSSGGPFRPLRQQHVAHLDPGHASEERRGV